MDDVARIEENARGRVVELCAQGTPPIDAVGAWIDARRDLVERLRVCPPEDTQRFFGAELKAIESQVERLEEGGHASREVALRNAVELGQRLRWVLWLSDVLSDELTVDPLTLLEQELDRAQLRCDELRRLQPDQLDGVHHITAGIRAERGELLDLRIRRFISHHQVESTVPSASVEGTTHWRVVTESFQLEARMIEHADLAAETADPAGRASEGATFVDDLHARRGEHLERCRELVEGLGPAEAAEVAHVAITELSDEAGSLLSEGRGVSSDARLGVLALLKQRIGVLRDLIAPLRAGLLESEDLAHDDRERFRSEFKQLGRTQRQTSVAENETLTRRRLERFFGVKKVRFFEATITFLVFVFLALVIIEWFVTPDQARILHWIDLGLCVVFQADFLMRWRFSRWNRSYFLRHFWLESLPALPFGLLLANMQHVQSVSFVRAIRFGRLLLSVRVFRLLVFVSRGFDSMVERFRRVLDRDIVLFDQTQVGDSPESPLRRRTLALEVRRQRFMRNTYQSMSWSNREGFLPSHISTIGAEVRMSASMDLPYRRAITDVRGEVNLERIIQSFLTCDVARALSLVGRDGALRLTRLLRLFDLPGIRRLPILRRIVPHSRGFNPAEAVSAMANTLGALLQEALGAVRFWGDLSGITTGPQILDRVASGIITATKRPAIRLILLGTLLGVLAGLAGVMELDALEKVFDKVYGGFGLPLVILGLICFVFLMAGMWMKRIAGEALGQFLRTADAHYYPLLKARKFLSLRGDMEMIFRSVLKPECSLRGVGDACDDGTWIDFLSDPFAARARFIPRSNRPSDPRFAALNEERDLIALLYRDFLDGPVLHRSDDKTSGQLLGGLTIQEIRKQVLTLDSKSQRRLRKLDLERGGLLNLGPYFWFRFITESLAIETAKQIMEYNMTCIPIDQLTFSSDEAIGRFRGFLDERLVETGDRGAPDSRQRRFGETLLTGSFTAFDFLGPSAESDQAVRERYGDEVFECLRRDRRAVVRDVFGTRPYHLLPRNQRVLNPYLFYRRHFGGARIFLLPLTFFYSIVKLLASGVRQVLELIREVLGKKKVLRSQRNRNAGFDVAVRKINRMRKPFFIEALNLRAALDVEYLGLRLPGQPRHEDCVTYSEDLDFIGALETERKSIQELRDRAIRDLREFRLFLGERGWTDEGLVAVLEEIDPSGKLVSCSGEVVRALVTAYITNHGSLRTLITAPGYVREFVETSLKRGRGGIGRRFVQSIFAVFARLSSRYHRRCELFDSYVTSSENIQRLSAGDRALLRRELVLADGATERRWELAVQSLSAERSTGEDPVEAALRGIAKDYSLWTRRLITVRTVQTLTVLDIRSYRDMVWDIGEYAESSPIPSGIDSRAFTV